MFKKIFPVKSKPVNDTSYFDESEGEHHLDNKDTDHLDAPLEQLLNFISDHVVELNKKSKEKFAQLTVLIKSLNLLPDDGIFVLLGAHGWNGECFDLTYTNNSFVALKQSLSTLYFNGLTESDQNNSDESNAALKTDEGLMFSFCPNILFSHVESILSTDHVSSERNAATSRHVSSDRNPVSSRHVSSERKAVSSRVVRPKMFTSSTQFNAACILADISGFTKLSCAFCQKGSSGLDKLHKTINGFLAKFVQIVYTYKGDVISFAGDALVCIFRPEEGEEESSCCVQATQCAMELSQCFTPELTAHIAVSFGSMSFCSLGGFKNEWVYLMNGACISELSNCIDEAGSKQVVVTEAAFEACTKYYDALSSGKKVGSVVTNLGNRRIIEIPTTQQNLVEHSRYRNVVMSESLITTVELFVPRPISEAIKSNTFNSLSELREVTTLFLKIDTYCPVKNRDPLTLQPFYHMAQEALFTTGGFLRQFLIDDKGCVLIAMWGVPTASYSHNCSRAVVCATSIRLGCEKIDVKCSMGITTGTVFCGNIGSVARRDFVGIGDKVNLAARLMGKSKGRIYMDVDTCTQLPAGFRSELKTTEGLALKGVTGPVYAFYCENDMVDTIDTLKRCFDTAHKTRVQYLQIKIAELLTKNIQKLVAVSNANCLEILGDSGTLMSLSTAMHSSNVTIAIVEGASGSGKTIAASFFRGTCKKLAIRVYHIMSRSRDFSTPYGIIRKLIFQIAFYKEKLNKESVRVVVQNLVTQIDWGMNNLTLEQAKLECSILFGGPDKANTDFEFTENFMLVILQYFLSLQPYCGMVIEDAHFCDECSWNVIAALLHMPYHCAVLITIRHHQLSASTSSFTMNHGQSDNFWGRTTAFLGLDSLTKNRTESYMKILNSPFCDHIQSGGLSLKEVRKLMAQTLKTSSDQLKDDLVQIVLEVSSGNGYWCQEISDFILERGLDEFYSTVCDKKNGASTNKNPLRALVVCRLEKLTIEHQLVLKYASVIGEEFTLLSISAVLPSRLVPNVQSVLDVLINSSFIYASEEEPGQYCFGNQNIRQMLCDLTPMSESSRIHLGVCNHIQDMFKGESLSAHFSTLSYHYSFVENGRPKALKFAMKAAEDSAKRGAFSDASNHCEDSLCLSISRVELKFVKRTVEFCSTQLQKKSTGIIYGESAAEIKSTENFFMSLLERIEIKCKMTASRQNSANFQPEPQKVYTESEKAALPPEPMKPVVAAVEPLSDRRPLEKKVIPKASCVIT